MRTHNHPHKLNPSIHEKIRSTWALAVALAASLAAPSLLAANGTWTNAPVDASWPNTNNWVGQVVPGQVNNTGNNGVDTSLVTFNSPLLSGIGGAANPIVPDDATVANGKARMMGQLNFIGANCGAYVFYSPSPFAAQTSTTPETGVLSLCCPTVTGNNGSYIDAAVVNPQVFLVPVQIRLPSSTTGTYGFTNNAASVNATYYFSSLFEYPQATGRGVTFVFAGSNTGTNTVNLLSQSANQSGSPSGVRKEGTGRWILSGANVFNSASAMNINDGTLEVQNPAAFGSATTVTVNSNGVLQVDGVTLSTLNFNLNQSGTIRLNGSATINGVTVSAAPGTTTTVATTSGSDVLALGNAGNMVTGGAVDSVLHIAGLGMVQLGYVNNYAGSWSLDAGTLQISGAAGALGAGADFHIAAGATFDVAPITSGASYSPATAGISASGAGATVGTTAATIMADSSGTIDLASGSKIISLDYTPTSFAGDSAHPALYVSQGTLSLGGNSFTINNASGTPLGVGTYQLILQASGSVASSGGYSLTGVTGSGLAAGTVGNIVVNGNEVDLVVSIYTPKNLVWKGGNPNSDWDINNTLNFLNGGSPSVFNNSDNVTFDSTGAANPNVNLAATVAPSSVTVDTSGGDYTLSGSGRMAGATGLTKTGTGTLQLATVNSYGGDTVISNGVLQLGVNDAISSPTVAGGDLDVKGPGTLDLNGFNNTVNALIGSGTVDSASGGTPVLTVGNNNDDGTFAGTIQNTSGTLSLIKAGTGVETLSGVNTYSGSTTVSAGTLGIASSQSFPAGNAVVVDGGILDLGADLTIGSLSGVLPGTIANNSTSSTNTLTIDNSAGATMTYSGHIYDNTGSGGALALKILGAGTGDAETITLTTPNGDLNHYSGGTLISNAFVYLGTSQSANPNTFGMGPITFAGTNHTTLALARSVSGSTRTTGSMPNDIVLSPNTEVQFVLGSLPYSVFTGSVSGPANSEIIWNNHYARSGVSGNWTNFYGKVLAGSFAYQYPAGDFRLHAASGFNGIPNGRVELVAAGSLMGDYTVYTNDVSAYMYSADGGQTYYFGELSGQTGTTIDMGTSTIIVGGLGTDAEYDGVITNGTTIVKDGAGTWTLMGGAVTNVTTPDGFTYYTNVFYANLLSYTGSTTISNGVLKVAVPDSLTNGPTTITLAASTAVLDASDMGYISNYSDATVTNQTLITNGVFEVVSGQTLAGLGTIRAGKVLLDAGSILSIGLPTGVLEATNNLEMAGAVNINLNRDNTPNSGELMAQSFTIDSTATLVVTNVGPALVNGDKFTLFDKAVDTNLFASVMLPATDPTGTTNYVWQNDLSVDGTITLVSGGVSPINQNPPPIIFSFSGNTLSLSWPTNSGWILQMQTNGLASGNWVDVPGSGSMTSTNITVDANHPTVFYRLRLP